MWSSAMGSCASLIHDVASATSMHVLEVFAGCIREDEARDAFDEIYVRIRAGIEAYQIQSTRTEPSPN
jgi:hypothetical protein